jgi:hypothetical protein
MSERPSSPFVDALLAQPLPGVDFTDRSCQSLAMAQVKSLSKPDDLRAVHTRRAAGPLHRLARQHTHQNHCKVKPQMHPQTQTTHSRLTRRRAPDQGCPATPQRPRRRTQSRTHAPYRTANLPIAVWPCAQTTSQWQRHGRYPPESNRHPGKMLPALARRAIDAYSDPGDLILDPMCGIGTMLVEAIHTGRRAVGVELEPRWASSPAPTSRTPTTKAPAPPRTSSKATCARHHGCS